MKNPLVSIIIPVYNGSNYLKEAIESALAQSYKNVEVLVINDGSTDHGATEKIAKSFGNRIRYFHQQNGGVATALNHGIKKMRGEWFAWLSHDDIYLPDKIKHMIGYTRTHPKAYILYSNYELVDAELKHLHDVNVKPDNVTHMCFRLAYSYPLNGCAMLIKKTCFNRVGLFDPKLRTTQDYDMWFRLAKLYPYDYVPILSIKSRLHSEQGSHTYAHIGEVDQLLSKYFVDLTPAFLRQELGSKAKSWILMITRAYKSRGYHLALKSAWDRSLELSNQYSLDYLYTKLYCLIPQSLIEPFNRLSSKLEGPIFGLTGSIKRLIRRIM